MVYTGVGAMNRRKFEEVCRKRDNDVCVIPWCDRTPDEVHHIIERSLWDAEHDGYIVDNGASVCNLHHQYAESNDIPPSAFWNWVGVREPPVPQNMTSDIDKWGHSFNTPRWEEEKDFFKYQSTRHLMPLYWNSSDDASSRIERDDSEVHSVDTFLNIPLVATIKMDGSNAMVVKDAKNPVRARNGSHADHPSFDMFKQMYDEMGLYTKIPESYQIFGEWLYSKHSIHYGCSGCCERRNQGPHLKNGLFQVFGIFDTDYNLWLSWDETERWAKKLGFNTAQVVYRSDNDSDVYEREYQFISDFVNTAENIVDQNHEGIVLRSRFPFHYGQFSDKLSKFVRPNHVDDEAEHHKHTEITRNHQT